MTLPSGALGVWYANQYASSPRAYIPNSATATAAQPNLTTLSRRNFANLTCWSSSSLSITDANATAPDGSGDASTISGTGEWYLTPQPLSVFPLPAGNYTLAINVKYVSGDANFQLGFFPNNLTTFTATGSWQRFSTTINWGGGSSFPIILADGLNATSSFIICDFELYAGTSDLGPNPLAGHMYLCNADGSPGASVSNNLIDFSTGKFGAIQFNSTSATLNAFTCIYVGKLANSGVSGIQCVVSYAGNGGASFKNFAVFNESNSPSQTGAGMYVNGGAIGFTQNLGSGTDLVGQNASIFTHTYDGATANTWVNDVKLLSNTTAGSFTNITAYDLFVGIVDQTIFFSGYQITAVALWPSALSDAQVQQAVNTLIAQANIDRIPLTWQSQKTVLFIGDSITEGFGASPGFAYLVPSSANPIIKMGNYGQSGARTDTYSFLSINVATIARAITNNRNCYCQVFFGANDLAAAIGLNAFLANLRGICVTLQQAGAVVFLTTVLPRTAAPAIDEGVRAQANAAIRSYVGTYCSAVVDFASDPIMGSFANSGNTTYYQDGVHPTTLGHTLLAPYSIAAINTPFKPLSGYTTLNSVPAKYFSKKHYNELLDEMRGNAIAARQAIEDFSEKDLAELNFKSAKDDFERHETALYSNVTAANHFKLTEAKERQDRARKDRDHHYFMEVVKREWEKHGAKKH